MFGDSYDFHSIAASIGTRDNCGLVYRACEGILSAVQSRRPTGIDADLFVSYVEGNSNPLRLTISIHVVVYA
jgi:hypothetical protein